MGLVASLWDCISFFFFFSSRRRHTRCSRDWSSDVCSSDLDHSLAAKRGQRHLFAVGIQQGEVGGEIAGRESLVRHVSLSLGQDPWYALAINGASARKARPRWLIASLASAVISAVVCPNPSGRKIGS